VISSAAFDGRDLLDRIAKQASAQLPVSISCRAHDIDLLGFAAANRAAIEELLAVHGALLFRDTDLSDVNGFRRFAKAVSEELYDGAEHAAPRREVANQVFTSTEYPPSYPIPLHHENAFAYRWPLKLFFYCAEPAASGGATLIADGAEVTRQLDPDLREEFTRKQILYVRNYGVGIDLSWQDAFRSSDRSTVERYCAAAGIQYEWLPGDRLRTRRLAPAIVVHQPSGNAIWFNHAHLFHVSNLEPTLRATLTAEFADDDLPRNVFFGDGTPIASEALDHVRQTYERSAIPVQWSKGDVLMLDNITVAHGRQPFTGSRRILVAMADPSSPTLAHDEPLG
jgi:alpha-ketoglutarate-dependent taurine dioxygenase